MNLPNQLTLFRMLCVIFIIALWLIDFKTYVIYQTNGVVFDVKRLIIFLLFIIGSFTDYLDGYLARKHNLITTFGKFMDPIADKLLVNTVFILLTSISEIPVIITIIMISRDTIVDAIRLVMMDAKVVIAASPWGKAKTVTQMIALIAVLLLINIPLNGYTINVGLWLSYLAAIISLISGCDYFWKNRKTLLKGMLQ